MEPCQTGVAAGLVFGSSAIRRSILHFCKNNVFGMKSKAGIYFSPFQRSTIKRKRKRFFSHSIFAFARFGRRINVCISILNKTAFFSPWNLAIFSFGAFQQTQQSFGHSRSWILHWGTFWAFGIGEGSRREKRLQSLLCCQRKVKTLGCLIWKITFLLTREAKKDESYKKGGLSKNAIIYTYGWGRLLNSFLCYCRNSVKKRD